MSGPGRRPPPHSAGILLYRRTDEIDPEVLLGHPGGPFWARRDAGAWTIPKGECLAGEDALATARREFAEETGHAPAGLPVPLGETIQANRKRVTAFAIEGEFDPALLKSNTFEIEWPPRSGRRAEYPELDRVAWFSLAEAGRRILPAQAVFLDRLAEALAASREPRSA